MFEIIDRPERNRRGRDDMQYDFHLERALLDTLRHGRAIKVRLNVFHCTPCKGRLYDKGYRLLHRVLPDKEHVAAWIETCDESQESGGVTQELLKI